jgi:hypothetical protein
MRTSFSAFYDGRKFKLDPAGQKNAGHEARRDA